MNDDENDRADINKFFDNVDEKKRRQTINCWKRCRDKLIRINIRWIILNRTFITKMTMKIVVEWKKFSTSSTSRKWIFDYFKNEIDENFLFVKIFFNIVIIEILVCYVIFVVFFFCCFWNFFSIFSSISFIM